MIQSSNSFSNNENQTEFSSFFQLFTSENEIFVERDEWFNVNQSKSLIFWKKLSKSTYILRSEGQCLRQMCSIKLKYNGTKSKRKDGCLAFILETQGQPSITTFFIFFILNILF